MAADMPPQLEVNAKVYGQHLGYALATWLHKRGLPAVWCYRVYFVFFLMRLRAGRETSWHWGARSFGVSWSKPQGE